MPSQILHGTVENQFLVFIIKKQECYWALYILHYTIFIKIQDTMIFKASEQ
jgi:hypothetical protein